VAFWSGRRGTVAIELRGRSRRISNCRAAVGTRAGSTDPALILLADVWRQLQLPLQRLHLLELLDIQGQQIGTGQLSNNEKNQYHFPSKAVISLSFLRENDHPREVPGSASHSLFPTSSIRLSRSGLDPAHYKKRLSTDRDLTGLRVASSSARRSRRSVATNVFVLQGSLRFCFFKNSSTSEPQLNGTRQSAVGSLTAWKRAGNPTVRLNVERTLMRSGSRSFPIRARSTYTRLIHAHFLGELQLRR
jgi:hypothetical protein